MIYLWGILASTLAVSLEALYRRSSVGWWSLLPLTILPILLLNYALFRLLRGSDSLLHAFIMFALCNLTLRTLTATLILRENVSTGTWIALGLVLGANVCKIVWR